MKELFKKFTKKRIIIIAIILLCIAIIIISSIWLYKVYGGNTYTYSPIDEDNLQVFMDGDYYLGNESYSDGLNKTNTFSLIDILGLSETDNINIVSNNLDIATISANNNITVLSTGTLNIDINDLTTSVEISKKIYVVEGINIPDFEHFFYAVEEQESIVLQADLLLLDPADKGYLIEPTNEDHFHLYANLYGNGHVLDCSEIMHDTGDNAFSMISDYITIRDVHIIGRRLTAENTIHDLEDVGVIISVDGEKDDHLLGAVIEHCILENAHKIVTVNNSDLLVKGTIIRNASDSCMSIHTNNDGTSNINIENCVMGNAVVSCMTFWCMDEIETESNFITLNITGFLDIYNWKDIENAQIVPNTESLAGIVNPLIQDWMKQPQYQAYYFNYLGKQYVHSAILIISTPPSKGNFPTINGLDSIGFTRRDFPFPDAAKTFIKTCVMCGYIDNPPILPDGKISDNPKIYQELRDGRDN